MRRTIRVELTFAEANALVRVVAAGNASDGWGAVDEADKVNSSWAVKRIITLLDAKADETGEVLELAAKLRETKPKRGSIQDAVLRSLREYKSWTPGCGWLWDSASNTQRILESLVKRGDAIKVTSPRLGRDGNMHDITVYHPLPA